MAAAARPQGHKILHMNIAEELVAEIEDFRFQSRQESKTVAVERLVKLGLAAWRAGYFPEIVGTDKGK